MNPASLNEFIPVLQIAVGPVILISGVGLLLLSLTNRFGRVVDRSRLLARELKAAAAPEHPALLAQVRILSRRARILRLAIVLALLSALAASLLIIGLFWAESTDTNAVRLITVLFVGAMAMLFGALLAFLVDTNLSLKALKLEVGTAFNEE